MHPTPDSEAVARYLEELHARIVAALGAADGGGAFREDTWQRPGGGGGRSSALEEGATFERAGVGFSHVRGASLPASATAARPEITGWSYEAMGVSLIVHPRNPYVPTSHANVRFFVASRPDQEPGRQRLQRLDGGLRRLSHLRILLTAMFSWPTRKYL